MQLRILPVLAFHPKRLNELNLPKIKKICLVVLMSWRIIDFPSLSWLLIALMICSPLSSSAETVKAKTGIELEREVRIVGVEA